MSWQKLYTGIKIVIRLGILLLMIGLFGIDLAVVQSIPKHILYAYGLVILACIIFFFATLFPKLRKKAYILFLLCFFTYITMYNFVPEIIIQHKIDSCIDKGLVWDGDEQKCRNDCWHWSKETGCKK